jgi:hypothetical protein
MQSKKRVKVLRARERRETLENWVAWGPGKLGNYNPK